MPLLIKFREIKKSPGKEVGEKSKYRKLLPA